MNKVLTKLGQAALMGMVGYEVGKPKLVQPEPTPVVLKIDKEVLDNQSSVISGNILLLIVIIMLIIAMIIVISLALRKKAKPRREATVSMHV